MFDTNFFSSSSTHYFMYSAPSTRSTSVPICCGGEILFPGYYILLSDRNYPFYVQDYTQNIK